MVRDARQFVGLPSFSSLTPPTLIMAFTFQTLLEPKPQRWIRIPIDRNGSAPLTAEPNAEVLVSDDCAVDARIFCGSEANVLTLLHEIHAGVTPVKLEAAAVHKPSAQG